MSQTYIDAKGCVTVHIFSKNCFEKIKIDLRNKINLNEVKLKVEQSKIFDVSKGIETLNLIDRKSKQIIVKDILNEEFMSELKDVIRRDLQVLIGEIFIENNVTLVMYEKDDFFSKHTDFVSVFIKETTCMHLLLYLESAEEGGETVIHTGRNTIKTKTDLIFDKRILHESLVVERGTKIIALFNVILNQKKLTANSVLAKIDFVSLEVLMYIREQKDLSLCYCDFKIQRFEGNKDNYRAGVLMDRTGRCVKVHLNGDISLSPKPKRGEYESFEVFCYCCMHELDDIWVADKKNIAWEKVADKKSFLPSNVKFFQKLINIASEEHSQHVEMAGFCNSEKEYICCSIARYYFNLPKKKDLVFEAVNLVDHSTEITSSWAILPIEIKEKILDHMTYEELFDTLLK
ncbi:ORF-101 [Teiidae poxvirus 1]|nr:ORF-101 [Teiidae poxvirus 1]